MSTDVTSERWNVDIIITKEKTILENKRVNQFITLYTFCFFRKFNPLFNLELFPNDFDFFLFRSFFLAIRYFHFFQEKLPGILLFSSKYFQKFQWL